MTDRPGHDEQHPRGTLALMGVLGVLFLAVYFGIYFLVYVPRGALTP